MQRNHNKIKKMISLCDSLIHLGHALENIGHAQHGEKEELNIYLVHGADHLCLAKSQLEQDLKSCLFSLSSGEQTIEQWRYIQEKHGLGFFEHKDLRAILKIGTKSPGILNYAWFWDVIFTHWDFSTSSSKWLIKHKFNSQHIPNFLKQHPKNSSIFWGYALSYVNKKDEMLSKNIVDGMRANGYRPAWNSLDLALIFDEGIFDEKQVKISSNNSQIDVQKRMRTLAETLTSLSHVEPDEFWTYFAPVSDSPHGNTPPHLNISSYFHHLAHQKECQYDNIMPGLRKFFSSDLCDVFHDVMMKGFQNYLSNGKNKTKNIRKI